MDRRVLVFVALAITMLYGVTVGLSDARDVVAPVGGVVVALVGYQYGNPAALERRTLLLGLVAIWAIRLSLHITVRNWGEPEDYRYQEFRRKYGPERY